MKKNPWYKDGIQFQCQGSGRCCQSRGQYGYVYLTSDDIQNAAKALKISKEKFLKLYGQQIDGFWGLKDSKSSTDCIFLKNNRCEIYEGRPTQCRTWPFWPEVMNPKSWNKSVVEFCPGVNKGKTYSREEIEQVLKTQKAADRQLQREHNSKS